MRLPLIFLIVCAALIMHIESDVVLYPPKNDMNGQQYIDRASYLAAIVDNPINGGARCTLSNDSPAGPFKVHLEFPAPLPGQDIHSLSLSAIMQTNVGLNLERRRLDTIEMQYNIVDLTDASTASGNDYYYSITIPDLEFIWIKTDIDPKWKFSSVFKFSFLATENGGRVLNVLVQCPVTLTRPKTVSGSYSSSKVTSLTSTSAGQVDIDLSITASLLPCIEEDKTDVSICTKETELDPSPEYPLNSYGKFILYLDNSDFAGVYYLIKNKVEMKSGSMPGAADFTNAATAGPILQGFMVFKLPMAIVGDPITVSAIATLSITSPSRRMMSSAAPKATYAAIDVGVSTNSERLIGGLSSYLLNIILFLGIILIMI